MMDDRDVESKGRQLAGRTVDVVVSGGVAGIETPRLIRELRRYGASVRVFMTPAATQFVSPLTFEWASKNPVVVELSGSAEHITQSHAVIVAPATLDFISKLALGLADSAAATLVQSAFSRMPVFIAPSMHLSLQGNPAFAKNMHVLSEIPQVQFLHPELNEGKAKMMSVEAMAAHVCHAAGNSSSLRGVPVLVTLGPTRSYADDMRYLSNRSTGELGLKISEELFRRGADVSVVAGPTQIQLPEYLKVKKVETNDQMFEAALSVVREKKSRVGVFSAAVLDFEFDRTESQKVSSKSNWNVELKPSLKLIQRIDSPDMLRVGFKLESRLSVESLQQKAKDWASETKCEFVIANRLEDVKPDAHRAFIWSASSKQFHEAASKKEIAENIVDLLEKSFS